MVDAFGSAIILTLVRSKPRPARETAAATFMFLGNFFTASAAVPSKRTVSFVTDMPREEGGFLVVRETLSRPAKDAEDRASKPPRAPEGR